jgi:hypothetical protein
VDINWLWVILAFVVGCVVTGLAMMDLDERNNLTKEELSHCVQMIVNDMNRGYNNVQLLLTELIDFANNDDVEFEHLSREARDIINKVKNILSDGSGK